MQIIEYFGELRERENVTKLTNSYRSFTQQTPTKCQVLSYVWEVQMRIRLAWARSVWFKRQRTVTVCDTNVHVNGCDRDAMAAHMEKLWEDW